MRGRPFEHGNSEDPYVTRNVRDIQGLFPKHVSGEKVIEALSGAQKRMSLGEVAPMVPLPPIPVPPGM